MIQFLRQNPALGLFILIFLIIRIFWSGFLPLMDFSEARYAEMARKMLEYDDWITLWFSRELPFWGKPPLSFWAVATSFTLFGINEFASRLPSLLFTLATAGLIYHWVKLPDTESEQHEAENQHNLERTARFAFVIYLSCWLVLHTAGAVITDPALTFSTTLVMMGFWRGVKHGEAPYTYLMWGALGFGLLTKGPIALVLCGLPCAFWVLFNNQWRLFWPNIKLFTGLILMLLVAAPWYWLAEQKTPGFFEYFIIGEHFLRFTETAWSGDLYGGVKDQPHGTIWLYLIVALLPFSPIVLIRALRKSGRSALKTSFQTNKLLMVYLIAWLLAPVLFFTVAKNILITYVLTGIPAASILIAKHVDDWLVPQRWFYRFVIGASLGFCLIYTLTYQLYIKDHYYNQKPLVAEYLELNETNPGPLVYWGDPLFSVIFYTGDQVVFPGPKVHEHYYDETHYHAVRNMWIQATESPSFFDRCTSMKYHGDYTLFYCPQTLP